LCQISWLSKFRPPPPLEGYLHPDTYRIFVGASNADIAGKMLANLDRKFTADMRAEMARRGLSLPEIITMASLVEKEARIDATGQKDNAEAKLVAGIFWKRISTSQRLESCATLAYILGVDKKQYTLEDTQIDSPYNTYRRDGLPPGPIGNPSLEAIKAALYPQTSDYLFFLNGHDGNTYFAKTYQEHLTNKDKYLK
jgi:UPF0755 protein